MTRPENDQTSIIEIRTAQKENVPLILEFIKLMATYVKMPDLLKATEESLTESLFGSKQAAEVSLIYEGSQAVGYAVYFHNFSTIEGKHGLYLEDLFIKPPFRGKGIGKKVLKHLANLALERGCTRFEWLVADWNKPAVDFYRKIGSDVLDEFRVCRMNQKSMEQYVTKEL